MSSRKSRTDKSVTDPERVVVILGRTVGTRASRLAALSGLAVLVVVVRSAAGPGGRPGVATPGRRPAARAGTGAGARACRGACGARRHGGRARDGRRGPARALRGELYRRRGHFSGGVEDWGEAGVGSVKQRACSASTPVAAPVQGSYVAVHKWRAAGSYPVSFAVTTYTCSNGRRPRRRTRRSSRWSSPGVDRLGYAVSPKRNGLGGALSDARGQLARSRLP